MQESPENVVSERSPATLIPLRDFAYARLDDKNNISLKGLFHDSPRVCEAHELKKISGEPVGDSCILSNVACISDVRRIYNELYSQIRLI